MDKIIPIPAFKDNYIWCLINSANNSAVIVDPGQALPVLAILSQLQLKLCAILITHHHADHSGGITEICAKYPVPVYGSAQEKIQGITRYVNNNDIIDLPEINLKLEILAIPGHTAGHILYYGGGILFCGDTLFCSGCGRLFEGTAEQMYKSLCKIAAFPDETMIYCGHEYTEANLKFAATVEPENVLIKQRLEKTKQLRNQGIPTVPCELGVEKQTNPFLRCHIEAVKLAAETHAGIPLKNSIEVFAALRAWKDQF